MSSVPQVTLADKLMIVPHLTRVLASFTLRIFTRPFSSAKANTVFKDLFFAALRTHVSIISPATEQWINPSTESGYLDLAKKRGFQPDTDILSSGLKCFWLGSKNAEKIILYFHGGGYVLSASPGHFDWLFDLQDELAKKASISVIVVGYTLAPHGQYPSQLKEAAESLQWLLETQKKKPSNIFIGGDSAGGNMTMSLMSHILHPHPQLSTKILLSEPLAGAILISPWVKFPPDDDSVKRNATSDMVTPQAAKRWSSLFLGPAALDNYNQPILANLTWFRGLDLKIKDVLVWGGGGEVLIDSIQAIGKTLKDANPKTEVVIEPGAAHEDFIIEKMLGYKEKGEGTKLIESWVAARI